MDVVLLSRLQFAMTVGFHFIFPSMTIGLAWLLVVMEWLGWRKNDAVYVRMAKFYARLFAITFAVGVATGLVMVFQFGMNWAEYSKFVGDVFGAPLAAEAVFAFFLESVFLGLYLFGRGKVSKGVHWFSCLMVAVGSTMSAFWIIVANSWQQTPAGFVVRNGRAELTSFLEAVFNPSTIPRFLHTVDATLITGAFFVAGIAAYLLLKNKDAEMAKKAIRLVVLLSLVVSVLELFAFGHMQAVQVARRQPTKLAAMEGLFEGGPRAPMTLVGVPVNDHLAMAVRVPGMLSLLVHFRLDGEVPGLLDFPREDWPPVLLTFASFHAMVGLGTLFIVMMLWAVFRLWQGKLWDDRWFLRLLVWCIPLPVLACQLGWITAEVGRQPWIVWGLLRTQDAASTSVSATEVLLSLIVFGAIYVLLGALWIYLLVRAVKEGPVPEAATEESPS